MKDVEDLAFLWNIQLPPYLNKSLISVTFYLDTLVKLIHQGVYIQLLLNKDVGAILLLHVL